MRVLDIDLDFFVDPIAYWRSDYGARLSDKEYSVWEVKELENFLENKCKLSKTHKVKGTIVKHHHDAFYYLRDLIQKNELKVPFEIVHIDAHADLGLGDSGYIYVMTKLLHRPVEKRMNPKRGREGLTAGNYLVFLVACRWVSKIVFVRHPKADDDFNWIHFKDFDVSSNIIQLKKCSPDAIEQLLYRETTKLIYQDLEPEVPIEIVSLTDYVNCEPFDYVVVSRSPGYTPPKADKLLDVIKEYII